MFFVKQKIRDVFKVMGLSENFGFWTVSLIFLKHSIRILLSKFDIRIKKNIRSHIDRIIGILADMAMAILEFLLFAAHCAPTVYLPLFLNALGYTATEIGLLFAFFNAAGIVVPLLIAPSLTYARRLGIALCIIAAGLAATPVVLFRCNGFSGTALCMAVYASFLRSSIPVCDSTVNTVLALKRERYGYVRGFGSIGFIAMSFIMQRFVDLKNCTPLAMTAWMSIPALLLGAAAIPFVRLRQSTRDIEEHDGGNRSATLKSILPSFGRNYYLVLFVIFMQYVGMVPANQFISLYVRDALHSDTVGLIWAISVIGEIPFMLFSSRFIRRYGARHLILFGTAAVTVRMCICAFVPNIAGVVFAQLFHSITFGLFHPACISFCAKGKHGHPLVVSLTLFAVINNLASAAGASFGGKLIDAAGYRIMFCTFALIPLTGLAIYAFVRKPYVYD